ncbi:hypothetical protein [Methylobacterium nonmethylotrophicum]|uniref:Uncharacterized protein n=1 Tax=Methylobacterium nonmethylotrophicum TaxID=1141884 RepID=A0A4Z0NXA3_9HYPH|nr:hypothetical protein [Methylobacterium nonmethylotrophicum]TGE01199.1 hypothetical protein EU555_06260 [Methylobacterium nonmethylotrophicum]
MVPAGSHRETDLEMALRHVVEAERRILRQHALIARLGPGGGQTKELAERLLVDFQTTLAAHRAHLARLMPRRQA